MAVHDWVRTQADIGTSLGMDTTGLRKFIVDAHPEHNMAANLDARTGWENYHVMAI